MVGSKRYFGYEDDQGRSWAIQLDETAGENADFGLAQTVSTVDLDEGRCLVKTSKKNIEPRYVIMSGVDADGRVRTRRYTVGDVTATVWITPRLVTYVEDGITFTVTSLVGEVRHLIPTTDTGAIDGDVDVQVVAGP